ncbi:SusC/RagA family TonB-linked outer membrane protein [Dysgonomonas termitidis]|uniref:SusC/RagA family TonB-linked outer membrane protein n=1 Tax=Dysgonomonas termitidis TaxID=1516126 RepID=A0ABV9KT68_9BACT
MNFFKTFFRRSKKEVLLAGMNLFFLLLPVMAQSQDLAAKKISMNVNNVSLETAFAEIEKQSGVKFTYGEDINKYVANKVTIVANNISVNDAISRTLNNSNLQYTQRGNNVAISEKPAQSHSQSHVQTQQNPRRTGTVTDNTGGPLIGVSITIKGTSTGTVTDVDGKFSIQAKPGDTMQFSYVGFSTKTIIIGNEQVLNIVLEEDRQVLDEIVVVGYQSIRKSHLTGAVSSVKNQELNLTTPSMGQALVGKVAGVQISQVSGAPYNSTKIRVRGTVSVNASSDPLYVIDGYPSNADISLNPEDIESIEILKDAASAAIYGSRASGGVVMITTKRGKESKVKVDVNYQHTIGQLSKKVDLLNAQEFAELFVDAHNNTYRDLLVNAGKLWDDSYRSDNNSQRTQRIGSNNSTANIPEWMYDYATQSVKKMQYDTDWQDELYRTAQGNRIHLNITGGNSGIRYNLSGSYQNMEGIIVSTRQNRINLRSNIDMNVSQRFKAGANFALTSTSNREVQEGRFHQGPILAALVYLPIFKSHNEDGSLSKYEMASYSSEFSFQNDIDNPVAMATETIIRRTGQRSTYNMFGTYELFDGLVAKANLGMYTYNEKYDFYRPTSLTSGVNPPYSVQAQAAANAVGRSYDMIDYLGEFTLSYNKQLGEHLIQGVAGASLQENKSDILEVKGTGYQDDYIPELTGHGANASDISLTGNTRKSVWTMASYFTQMLYSFRSRYFLSASFRGDGSSLFGPLNRWGYFPSVSGAWTVSQEDFYQKAFGASSSLKLRASWGLSGNNNIGNYNHTQVMSSPVGVPNGSNSVLTAMYPEAFKDRGLGWESTSQLNTGFDLSLFNGRLSLIANYYNSHTYNLLFNQSISAISGSTSYLTNLPDSKIRNRGIDVQVDGWVVNTKDFSLKLGGNISVNRNKVLDLGQAGTILTNGAERSYMTHITEEGQPIGMFYGFKVAGMVRESDMANLAEDDSHYNPSTRKFTDGYKIKGPPRSVAQTAKLMPGDLYFNDTNGDGIVTDEDKEIIGSPHPDFIYGFNLTSNYKAFDFSASFNGSQGNKVLDGQDYYIYNMEGSGNNYKDVAQRYRNEQNPGNGKVYRASRGGTQSNSTRLSSFYLQDGSFLRCTNITLGYSLPDIAKMTHNNISSLRLYLAVDNAFTVTKYKGYNPEVDYNNGSNLTPGVDYGKYPLMRAFQAGVQLSF